MTILRTRMLIHQISTTRDDSGNVIQQDINFSATPNSKAPDNTWGQGATFSISITNPQVFGIFDKLGEVFFDIVTTDTPMNASSVAVVVP